MDACYVYVKFHKFLIFFFAYYYYFFPENHQNIHRMTEICKYISEYPKSDVYCLSHNCIRYSNYIIRNNKDIL